MTVNTSSGAWNCKRCGASGLLREFRTSHQRDSRVYPSSRTRAAAARNAFEITPALDPRPAAAIPAPSPTTSDDQERIAKARQIYARCPSYIDHDQAEKAGAILPEHDSPAASYLRRRGLTALFPLLSGVRYHPNYCNRGPAAIFPIYGPADDQGGRELMAIQGRFLNPADGQPKAMTIGKSSLGVFGTPEALRQDEVFVCEAPIDALSLAECGFPALALIGTNFPAWLPAECAGKRVLIATDADDAGEKGAGKLCDALAALGTIPERLKPQGAKDWNEFLQRAGRAKMTEALTRAAFPHRMPVAAQEPGRSTFPYPITAGARVGDVWRRWQGTVTAYHGPDDDFPGGWVDLVTDDGQQGQADVRYLCDQDGRPFYPAGDAFPYTAYEREAIAKARQEGQDT